MFTIWPLEMRAFKRVVVLELMTPFVMKDFDVISIEIFCSKYFRWLSIRPPQIGILVALRINLQFEVV